jgi:AraC family transcriptional regulator of arabinose operon
VGLSVSRLAHLIKEHTGRTLLQHVHQLRIREAQRLLKETGLSCADIAYEVGFSDQSYFAKRFRIQTGLSPIHYRRLYR